jgi:glyoxylase-like metal-dependent hydrolase (beta-lactamase superfamily II)
MAHMDSPFQHLPHGITVIDTGFIRPRFDAAWLVVEQGRAAYIDTGPNLAVPRLLAALEATNVDRADVDWLIVTHVHLDHAGGAGLLLQHLPNARLVVHPRGARHLVDPSVLIEGVKAVYGAEVAERDYGELVPVPADRVLTTEDGMVLHLAGRELLFLDTPGHARHHHCVWDAASRGWFTGDTFGIAYPDLRVADGPFLFPTTTPVQFEPEALHASIDRLLAWQPQAMYLTHFGRLDDVAARAAQLHQLIDRMVELALDEIQAPDRGARLRTGLDQLYTDALREGGNRDDHARIRELLAGDIELNAQGLEVWLNRQ